MVRNDGFVIAARERAGHVSSRLHQHIILETDKAEAGFIEQVRNVVLLDIPNKPFHKCLVAKLAWDQVEIRQQSEQLPVSQAVQELVEGSYVAKPLPYQLSFVDDDRENLKWVKLKKGRKTVTTFA